MFCSLAGALLEVWLMVGTEQVTEWSIQVRELGQSRKEIEAKLPMFSRQQQRGVGQKAGWEILWEFKTR